MCVEVRGGGGIEGGGGMDVSVCNSELAFNFSLSLYIFICVRVCVCLHTLLRVCIFVCVIFTAVQNHVND